MSQVMQTKVSPNTVNRVQINMNLKYEKRGMSPGIFLSIFPRWYGRQSLAHWWQSCWVLEWNFSQVLPRAKKYYTGSNINVVKVERKLNTNRFRTSPGLYWIERIESPWLSDTLYLSWERGIQTSIFSVGNKATDTPVSPETNLKSNNNENELEVKAGSSLGMTVSCSLAAMPANIFWAANMYTWCGAVPSDSG